MHPFLTLTQKLFKRYGRSGSLLLLLQLITVAIQLFALPFLTRLLPAAEFGIFQFSQALITWLSIFTVGNTTLGAKKGLVEGNDGTMWHVFLYRMKFIAVLTLACFIASAVLFIIGKPLLPAVCIIVGLFLFLGYLPQVSFPQMFLAKSHFGWFVFWQGLGLFLSQGAAVGVAALTQDVIWVLAAQYCVFALVCIIGFWHALKKYDVLSAYKKGLVDPSALPYGKKLISVEILQGTAGTLHNFIIGPLFGFASLAVFSIAARMDSLFRAIVASGYYVLYRDFAQKDIKELRYHFKHKFFFILFSSGILSVVLFALSYFYIEKFLPREYQGAILYVAVLVSALPALVIQSIIQSAFESKLRAEQFRFAIFSSQVIRIAFLLLGGTMGVMGITLSLTVSAWLGAFIFVLIFYEVQWLEKWIKK